MVIYNNCCWIKCKYYKSPLQNTKTLKIIKINVNTCETMAVCDNK
jgi:hypothetical protein